ITFSSGLESTTSVYDDNGNLTSSYYNSDDSQRVMTWDSLNRLIAMEILSPSGPNVGDKRVEFSYDAFSQRATQKVRTWTSSAQWSTGTTEYFRWDQGEIVQVRVGGSGS